jgi:hypothetical protein
LPQLHRRRLLLLQLSLNPGNFTPQVLQLLDLPTFLLHDGYSQGLTERIVI